VAKRHLKVSAADMDKAREDAKQSFGSESVVKAFPKSYLDEAVRTTAEISVLQASLGKGEATPAKIAAYYEAHKADYEQTCVSHILVDDEQKAKDLKAQLDKGGDFAELAKKESKDNQGTDGGSAAKGGSLGCLTAAESANFVPEFVAGYKDLPIGKVSDPVKSQFGYHLIKVTERKQQSLEEATPAITQQLSQDTQTAFNDLITSVARKAKVRVNPRYGNFDRDQLAVIPPQAPPAAGAPTTLPPGLSQLQGG
jgi:foldase protein PrsA